MPGYSSCQGYQYLIHRGAALRPEVVLLYFGYNESLPVSFLSKRTRSSSRSDAGLFEYRRRPFQRLSASLIDGSNLLPFALLRDEPGAPLAEAKADNARVRESEKQRPQLLAKLQMACIEIGCEVVFVVPWYREFEQYIGVLRRFAQTSNLELIDLPALLPSRTDSGRSRYFLDKVHPNAAGHELIAEEIYQGLSSRGL